MSIPNRKMVSIEIGPPPTRRSIAAASETFSAINPNSDNTKTDENPKSGHPAPSPGDPKWSRASFQIPIIAPEPAVQPEGKAPLPEKKSGGQKKRGVNRVIHTKDELAALKLPVLASHKAVESFTHIPALLQTEMKTRLCPAFDSSGSGRVDVDLLLKWIFKSGAMVWLFKDETKNGEVDLTKMTWKARNERAAAIIREAAAAIAEDKAIDRNEVVAINAKAMASLFNALDREITLTLPASLRGLSEQQIKDAMLTWIERVKSDFRKDLTVLREKVNESQQPK